MEILKKFFVSRTAVFRFGLAALWGVGTVFQSGAQIYTLSQNNSSVQIDATPGSAGVSGWQVDAVNQLNQQWFYYRVGSGTQEYPIDNISAPTVTPTGANQLSVVYANANYSVGLVYILTGNSPGSGISGINATITVKNLSASSLPFYFFQYSDFNLGGSPGGQTVQFFQSLGRYNKAAQTGNTESLTNTFSSGFNPPSYVEANLYNATLASLTDGSPTTLNGVTNAAGNVTYAMEWDLNLAAAGTTGDSLQISELMSLRPVPEPSASVLILSGTLVLALLHRRRR